MRKEIISEKEGIALALLFIINGSLILPTGTAARKDIWISVVFAIILSILATMIYSKILCMFPGKNFFDISEILFGKFIGKIVILLYIWFAFHLASLVFADYVHFISTVSFPGMQGYIIVLFPAILCIWGLKIGIEGLGRFSTMVLTPLIVLIIIVIYLMIPKMNLDNFLPIFENGMPPILHGTFSLFSFPFAETIVFLGIFDCFKESKSISRVYFISITLGGILILLFKSAEIAVLGIDSYTQYYFPAYTAVSVISIAHFIQRIEIIIGLVFSVGGLIKISVCMLTVCKGVQKIFSFDDYRFLVTPLTILNVAFAFITSSSITLLASFTAFAWRYYAFPFQVMLPLIMLALSLLKKNAEKRLSAK